MPIRVTCPKCHSRFNVSEQHAGKEGPCPKCKSKIKIPSASEKVVIHAPEIGPKDSSGRPVLKPISRTETKLSSGQLAGIGFAVIGYFLGALVIRATYPDVSELPLLIPGLAAAALAIPVAYAAYTFLRDQELGGMLGQELWMRVGICGLVYALSWFAMPIMEYAFAGYGLGAWGCALAIMLGLGATAAYLLLDLDFVMGLVHCGMYIGVCLMGRLISGIGVLPGKSATEVVPEVKDRFPASETAHWIHELVQISIANFWI